MMVDGLLNGFPARHGGTPIAGWSIVENPNLKWLRTWGTPISGNLYIGIIMGYDGSGESKKGDPRCLDVMFPLVG